MLFAVTTAKGLRFVGYVHGAGGSLAHLSGVEQAIRQATKGRELRIYEPIPGHVRMDVEGVCTYVDIRGAAAEVSL